MVLSFLVILFLIPIVGLIGLIGLILVVGQRLPVDHVAQVVRTIPASPAAVWSLVASPQRFPEWRRGIARVEHGDADEPSRWREFDRRGGSVPYELVDAAPPSRLVTRIADPSLPYGGSWTIALEDRSGTTEVTITERGEVRNPIFRFLSRYIFGQETTIKRYLDDLERAIVRNDLASKES